MTLTAPNPDTAAKNAHTTPPRVALLRGFWLNNFEMQNYAPLHQTGRFDLRAYATDDHLFETNLIDFPVETLRTPRRAPGADVPVVRRAVGRGLRARGQHEYWSRDLDRIAAESDLLHAAETANGFSWQAAQAAQALKKPLVLTVWENIPFLKEEDEDTARRKRETIAATELFLAITERARVALRVEGIPDERIRVIGCGVDLAHFRPLPASDPKINEVRTRFQIAPDDFVIVCVAQLLASKGLMELLSAVALLVQDESNKQPSARRLRVVVVGEGADRAALEARRDTLGLSQVVSFPGKVSYAEMPVVHQIADVFTLPSLPTPTWQEQFGMVLAESMACGKPVVSTLSGSIPDVVADAGVLVQSADPLALAQALASLRDSDSRRADYATRALAHARREFDANRIADRIADCYDEALAATASAGTA